VNFCKKHSLDKLLVHCTTGIFALSLTEKIKDLFPKDSFNNSIVLVLVNAIYFKGLWDQQFKKEYTEEMKFWLNKVLSIFSLHKIM
jgi:hypothetical protein